MVSMQDVTTLTSEVRARVSGSSHAIDCALQDLCDQMEAIAQLALSDADVAEMMTDVFARLPNKATAYVDSDDPMSQSWVAAYQQTITVATKVWMEPH